MSNGHRLDLKNLGKRVKALNDALVYVANGKDFRDLIAHLRHPGWTTPAEFIFASGIVDSMLAHTAALTKLKQDLLKGSKAVIAE